MTNNIVLLHGWGGTRESLLPLGRALEEKGFNVFNLEMPGHGSTEEMPRPWSMHDFALWLKKELEHLELKDYILLGHSFGGKLILQSLIEKLTYPEKIVLINISGIKPQNTLKVTFWKFISKIFKVVNYFPGSELLKGFVYRYLVRETDYYKTASMLRETFKIVTNEHLDEKLDTINIPTLLVWGRQDKETPLWMGEKLNLKINQSKLFVIDGTHGLPKKEPYKVAEIIIKNI